MCKQLRHEDAKLGATFSIDLWNEVARLFLLRFSSIATINIDRHGDPGQSHPPLISTNPSPFPARLAKLGLGLLKRRSEVACFLLQSARLAHCTFLNPLQLLSKRSLGIHHVCSPSGVKRPRNPHQLGPRDGHFFLKFSCSRDRLVQVLSEGGAALLQMLPADADEDSGVLCVWVSQL